MFRLRGEAGEAGQTQSIPSLAGEAEDLELDPRGHGED